MKTRHLPSIAWCALGFAAAGSGVGSLIGTAFESALFTPLLAGQGTPHERLLAFYDGTLSGIVIGASAGSMIGVLYAVLVRRQRRTSL